MRDDALRGLAARVYSTISAVYLLRRFFCAPALLGEFGRHIPKDLADLEVSSFFRQYLDQALSPKTYPRRSRLEAVGGRVAALRRIYQRAQRLARLYVGMCRWDSRKIREKLTPGIFSVIQIKKTLRSSVKLPDGRIECPQDSAQPRIHVHQTCDTPMPGDKMPGLAIFISIRRNLVTDKVGNTEGVGCHLYTARGSTLREGQDAWLELVVLDEASAIQRTNKELATYNSRHGSRTH
jgi:hypothetical protein